MTNLKTIFKQKTTLLLTLLCLFELAFSYSCNCKNNSTALVDQPTPTPEKTNDKIDPKFFTITTNSVTNLLVQKASDKSLAYQPSIKFSEANTNGYTLTYSTDDATFKDKLQYDEKTGLITLTDYNDLQESKTTIQIKFELRATNEALSNNTTNFTLSAGLKKTKGKIDVKTVIGTTLVQDADNITTSSSALFQLFYKDIQSTESYSPCKATPPTGQNTFSYSKVNFT